MNSGDARRLLDRLGVEISPALLERALTHRSFAYENGRLPTNERLEFLGDSVLGLVVTDGLFRANPDAPEGQLAKMRAAIVNAGALAGVAREIDLGSVLRLGRGELTTGGRDKSSILADTMEAVIGASYLCCGLDETADLIRRLFAPVIERAAHLGAGLDWKTSLQELCAANSLGAPGYVVIEHGPDHNKSFEAFVRIAERDFPAGLGSSKKAAEQLAAQAAWQAIRGDVDSAGAT